MQKKYSNYIINLSKITFLLSIVIFSCQLPAYSEKVYSGIKNINTKTGLILKIESYFPQGCNRDWDLCLPSNNLFLIHNNKNSNFSKLLRYWNDITYVYFVKISPKGYLDDLDGDGNLEVAIYPMVAGTNPVTDVYIYTVVENKLVFYGMGRFHFEWGPWVKTIVKDKWIMPNP